MATTRQTHACGNHVHTTVTPGTAPLVELCGWMTRCPECERKTAILRAHLSASRTRNLTARMLGGK